jgi:hypothetical protein
MTPNWPAIRILASGLLVPALCWAVGVDIVHSLLIATVTLGAAALLGIAAQRQAPYWPEAQEGRRTGNRREITRLSWMMTARRGGTDRQAVVRLRDLAQSRLARHGIDLLDPADRSRAMTALGADVFTILMQDTGSAPTHRALLRCVEALEALGSVEPPARPSLDRPVRDRPSPDREPAP